jgi:hypothetical protein
MSIDLNDDFHIQNIATKKFNEIIKLQKKLIYVGMKHVFVFTFDPYLFYLKTRVNKEIIIQVMPDNEFHKKLKNIHICCDDKSIVSFKTIFESRIGPAAVKNSFLSAI